MNQRIKNMGTMAQDVSPENSGTPFTLKSRSRIAALAGVVVLTGCGVTATQPLWRNNLAAQETATEEGAVVSMTGESYQLFSNNGNFQLRKLSVDGVEQWRNAVGAVASNFTKPLIAIAGGSIQVTSTLNALTSVDAAGNVLWTQDLTPQGAYINQLLAHGDDTVASYSGSETPAGIVAISTAGAEHWRYEFPVNAKVQLAALATGNLLAITDNGTDNLAMLYIFDGAGNLVQQQDIPVTANRVALVSRGSSVFLKHNRSLTRIDEAGNILWTQILPADSFCTAADEGEVACWAQQLPFYFPPYSSPGYAEITWFDADGEIKNKLVFPESFSLLTRIVKLHYNGEHRWTLEKFTNSPINLLSTSPARRFNHYHQFSVMTEQGYNLKTITMEPAVYEDSWAERPSPGYNNDGDNATAIVSQGRLYAFGNTRLTQRGFVSVYPIP